MDFFGGLCEACYGFAVNCFHCNGTGKQPEVNPLDLGAYQADPCPRGPANAPIPCIEGHALYEKHDSLSQLELGKVSDFYRDTLRVPPETLPNTLQVEQNEEVPAYRRHTKSKAQVKLLQDWFATNPNPTGRQLSEYAKLASLEKDQVRNWFVNQRRPGRNPQSTKASKVKTRRKIGSKGQHQQATTNSIAKPISIPQAAGNNGSSLANSLKSIPDAPESMLQRWQNSPPNEEPADFSAINNAVRSSPRLDTAPRFDQGVPRYVSPTDNIPVLIENIPQTMKMAQFVKIMLLKDIPQPAIFRYELTSGRFHGVAFAEFGSKTGAMFAVSRLNHTFLEGRTLTARMLTAQTMTVKTLTAQKLTGWVDTSISFDPMEERHFDVLSDKPLDEPALFNSTVLSALLDAKKTFRHERNNSWRSAASSNCSAASSAARSYASSISFARRKYKESHRRSESQDQPTNYMDAFDYLQPYPLLRSESSEPILLIDRPPTPLPASQPYPEETQACGFAENFGHGIEDEGRQDTESRMNQVADKESHSCQRYRCESCTHRFNTEDEWRAHETIVHRPREEWVCSFAPCMNPTMKDWNCAFCRVLFTDWDLLTLHKCRPCGIAPTSPTSKPVFNTRTGLADHVKHHHEGAILTPFMVKQWSRPPAWKQGIWPCGTCGAALQGWENRLNHLAGHFQLDILKTGCSCFRSPSITSVVSVEMCNNNEETSSLDHDLQNLPSPVNVSSNTAPEQSNAPSLFSRARAWITRRAKRP